MFVNGFYMVSIWNRVRTTVRMNRSILFGKYMVGRLNVAIVGTQFNLARNRNQDIEKVAKNSVFLVIDFDGFESSERKRA